MCLLHVTRKKSVNVAIIILISDGSEVMLKVNSYNEQVISDGSDVMLKVNSDR